MQDREGRGIKRSLLSSRSVLYGAQERGAGMSNDVARSGRGRGTWCLWSCRHGACMGFMGAMGKAKKSAMRQGNRTPPLQKKSRFRHRPGCAEPLPNPHTLII